MPKHAPFREKFGIKSGDGPTTFEILNDASARFWSRVDRRGDDDCWEWIGFVTKTTGHGKFQVNRTTYPSSRIALQLQLGRLLDRKEFACHHCDNPPCCNPKHLFVGSARDNAMDAQKKGRLHNWGGKRRGSANPCAKLTEKDVRLIKRMRGQHSVKGIADIFGVSTGTIASIFSGQNWSHVK